MTDHLSDIPGMAHFAGTGPLGKTCGDCRHRGIQRERCRRKPRPGEPLTTWWSYAGCAMFKKLTGKVGPVVSTYNHACKYFEEMLLKAEKR